MNTRGLLAERAVILTPIGRDSQIAVRILAEAGYPAFVVTDLLELVKELDAGAGLALIAVEALLQSDVKPLLGYLAGQPAWSDMPIVLLTHHGGQAANPAAHLGDLLGNVTFLERPFHPVTLVSLVATAVRGRRRQYDARTRMEDLVEGERRLQNALKAGRLGSWQLEADSLKLSCSAITKSHYGREEQDSFSYHEWLETVYPEDQPRMLSALQRSLDTGIDFVIEYRTVWPDGTLNWVDVRARAILGKYARVTALSGVTSDITERKQAEEQLRKLNETLEQQVEERTSQLQHKDEVLRQSQKMEAVGQLTGGIAHDFNNMLTGVLGALDLMRIKGKQQLQGLERYMEAAQQSAHRAAALTQRLLAFSRRQSLESRPMSANDLILALQDLLQGTVSEQISVTLELDPTAPWILADANQLENALLNLVINARDAMPDGGVVTLATYPVTVTEPAAEDEALPPGDYVCIEVRDTGTGIPERLLDKVLEPFFTTKPQGQGTGLGLSMVYGFARQSNGRLTLASDASGTRVCVYLPTAEQRREPQRAEPAELVQGAGQTILLVEDDDAVRLVNQEALQALGYRVWSAAEGKAALRLLDQIPQLDLLVTDVGLPGLNGRQLAEVIQQLRPRLPVLFLTGYAEGALSRTSFLGGNMELMTKPFTLDQLAAQVAAMLSGSANRAVAPS